MKKTLLFLGALLIITVSYSQTDQQKINNPIISASWTRLSGSMNVFGFLNSNSKLLNYNRYINTISFIQPKSPTYVTNPSLPLNAQSGAIVAYLGKNGGAQWDSTLVWSDPINWARYPSGAIYNPMGNSNYNNAYIVVAGPCFTSTNSWVGSYYASKSVSATPKNSPGNDMQIIPNTAPFSSTTSPTMTKHDIPRFSFTSTDDAVVRVAGSLYGNVNGVTDQTKNYRGGTISKGSFNSGVFVWTIDTFLPPCVTKTNGIKSLHDECWMAWNDAGTCGYLMFVGARQGSTGSNKGWQPIIFKTTNSGNTWVLVNGIDFNTSNGYDQILNSLGSINNNTLVVPFFNAWEGIDLSVDKNNKLHIFTTVLGTSSTHNDSLNFVQTYGPDQYYWPFTNNKWPYLIDFIGDGTNYWVPKIIDSCGTQAFTPAAATNSSFPWAGLTYSDPGAGIYGTAMRLQMSRSWDFSSVSEYFLYSWAESDSTLTTGATKFNEFPNIKLKAYRNCSDQISADEFVISSPATGFNPRVRDKAYFHFMSPTCRSYGTTTSAQFTLATTVSNNIPTDPNLPVDNYYSSVIAQFSFPSVWCGISISEKEKELSQFNLFPNPSSGKIDISLKLEQANDIDIKIFNIIGQKIDQENFKGFIGENTIPMDLKNCQPGIYFVKVKAGNLESTQKLIIE